MSIVEENDWVKDGDSTEYRKSIPLNSNLGQIILSDLSVRYPEFKPKYIDQIREYPGAPYDMIVATVIAPDGFVLSILDENGIPKPEDFHKDIASVTYIISGDS